MKPLIVRTDREVQIVEQMLEQLLAVADVVTCPSDDEAVICEAVREADVILTCYAQITARVIESATKLRGIVKYGVGVDSIDIPCATRHKVLVANCPDYGSNTVADHAFALLIGLARKIGWIDRQMQRPTWLWPTAEYLGTDLTGKRLGLIGLGRIGRAMTRRAAGFGIEQVASDPYVADEVFQEHGVRRVGLEELLRTSDFVSIHCVLTPETHHMLDEARLRMMKPSALLVNVSRGAIVEERAVVRALCEGWIAGGAFDVFVREPLEPSYPLLGMNNVILTPHFAWWTKEALRRVDQDTVDAALDVLQGRIPKHLKNPEAVCR